MLSLANNSYQIGNYLNTLKKDLSGF